MAGTAARPTIKEGNHPYPLGIVLCASRRSISLLGIRIDQLPNRTTPISLLKISSYSAERDMPNMIAASATLSTARGLDVADGVVRDTFERALRTGDARSTHEAGNYRSTERDQVGQFVGNLDYLASIEACGSDGSGCTSTGSAPVCKFLNRGALRPGADVISTFDPGSRTDIVNQTVNR
jgi:hypothetical protein